MFNRRLIAISPIRRPEEEDPEIQISDSKFREPDSEEKSGLNDPFLQDSLNDAIHQTSLQQKPSFSEPTTADFLGCIDLSIKHFQEEAKKPEEKSKIEELSETQKILTIAQRNSLPIESQDGLRKEFSALSLKYYELKITYKKLMEDHAGLRSKLEEIKLQNQRLENQNKELRQKLSDAELRISHTTDLYSRERIERENNLTSFKRMIEACTTKKPSSTSFKRDTMSQILRIEEDFTQKFLEIQSIKAQLIGSSRELSPQKHSKKVVSKNCTQRIDNIQLVSSKYTPKHFFHPPFHKYRSPSNPDNSSFFRTTSHSMAKK